ncbi:MAG TPA: hypothetical protein VGD99_05980 [Anaerolineae bacterium]
MPTNSAPKALASALISAAMLTGSSTSRRGGLTGPSCRRSCQTLASM